MLLARTGVHLILSKHRQLPAAPFFLTPRVCGVVRGARKQTRARGDRARRLPRAPRPPPGSTRVRGCSLGLSFLLPEERTAYLFLVDEPHGIYPHFVDFPLLFDLPSRCTPGYTLPCGFPCALLLFLPSQTVNSQLLPQDPDCVCRDTFMRVE